MGVLFLQKRSIRAGAQTSLARLVQSRPLQPLNPVVLLGGGGWLRDHLEKQGITALSTEFPSPRALWTRLVGMDGFAREVARLLATREVRISAIVANDHQECPLALAVAKRLGDLPVIGILRASAMSQGDFDKYACDQCDALMAVGTEMQQRVQSWTSKPLSLFQEGFSESEFAPLKPWPARCPRKVLVIGTENPAKGFTDFIDAVQRLETEVPGFPGFECDFTGRRPENYPDQPGRSCFRFLGRTDDFSGLVRQYDLAVHPSRAETFGMAPIEAMLAGTPTLVSATGVAKQLRLPAAWKFSPGDSVELCQRLTILWREWPLLDLMEIQQQVRESYRIDKTAEVLRQELLKISAE